MHASEHHLERLDFLRTRDREARCKQERGNAEHVVLDGLLQVISHLVGERTGLEHGCGVVDIEAGLSCERGQRCPVGDVRAFGEVGAKESLGERVLASVPCVAAQESKRCASKLFTRWTRSHR